MERQVQMHTYVQKCMHTDLKQQHVIFTKTTIRSTISGCKLSCEALHKYSFCKGIIPFASLKSIYNTKKVGSLEKMRC